MCEPCPPSSTPLYRIVFSDIDGTLLNQHYQLTAFTRERVRRLTAGGIPFVLVSARMPGGIYHVQKQLGITAPIICYSGALTLDQTGKAVHSIGLPFARALLVKQAFDSLYPEICCTAYYQDSWIADDIRNPWVIREGEITAACAEQVDFSVLAARTPTIHKFLCMGDPTAIARAEREMRVRFPDLTIYRSKDTYLEIMDEKARKSDALRALCAIYGIPVSASMAFGDHYNDADMLHAAGLGIAMGNAPEPVKEQADLVAPDNRHDGLAATLDRLWAHFDFAAPID